MLYCVSVGHPVGGHRVFHVVPFVKICEAATGHLHAGFFLDSMASFGEVKVLPQVVITQNKVLQMFQLQSFP